MVIKNRIYGSSQSVTLATGENYTIKDDEVYINYNLYKKKDLEIKLKNNYSSNDLRNGHLRSLPADFSKFNQWEIDGSVPSDLATGINSINDSIFFDEALQSEINDLDQQIQDLDSAKVEKRFLGWIEFGDDEYTETAPLSIPQSNGRALLPNNGSNVINITQTEGLDTILDSNKLQPDNEGDSYDWTIQFIVDPTLNNRNLTLELDIGGSSGVIWSKTIRLARGAGVDTKVSETIDLYTLDEFIQNGGEIYVTCDGNIDVYDIIYKIERKFRND